MPPAHSAAGSERTRKVAPASRRQCVPQRARDKEKRYGSAPIWNDGGGLGKPNRPRSPASRRQCVPQRARDKEKSYGSAHIWNDGGGLGKPNRLRSPAPRTPGARQGSSSQV